MVLTDLSNDTKCKYMLMFSQNNSTGYGLQVVSYKGTPHAPINILSINVLKQPGGHLNIKMLPYQYRGPHIKDKIVS